MDPAPNNILRVEDFQRAVMSMEEAYLYVHDEAIGNCTSQRAPAGPCPDYGCAIAMLEFACGVAETAFGSFSFGPCKFLPTAKQCSAELAF